VIIDQVTEDSIVRLAQAASMHVIGGDAFCITIEAAGLSGGELVTFRLSISHEEIQALYRAMRKATK
jgi:hypothetical protein